MARPALELTYRIEWDDGNVRYPPSVVGRILTERLHNTAIRDFEVSVVDDTLARVRLFKGSAPDAEHAKQALGMSGFALRGAAPREIQKSYVRTGRVPEGYGVWHNPNPMDGDYFAYGDSVLLEDPPLLTAELLKKARSWDDTHGEHGGGGVVLIDFDDTAARILDSRVAELYGRHPRGLMGITLGESLRSLAVVSSDRFQGRVLMVEPTELEARRLAAHLSSGYLPARLGATVEGRFVEGHPESEGPTGPPVDLEELAAEVVREGTPLRVVYDRLAECSEHGLLEQGISAIEEAMKRRGGTREAGRMFRDTIRWLGRLFRDASLGRPRRAAALTFPDDRSALAVAWGGEVRVLSLAAREWSKGVPLSAPLQGMEFVAPDRLVVRTAVDDRDVALEGTTVSMRLFDRQGPISVRGFECIQAGAILGKSRNGRFIAYRTARSGTVGFLDLDSVPEGPLAPLTLLDLQQPCTYPSWTHVAPDGGRVLVTTYDPEYLGTESNRRTRLFQLVDTRANQVLGRIKSAYENYYTFSWSPDGRWIACYEEDLPMPGWDVSVGSTLRDCLRLFNGRTTEEMWSVSTRRGEIGWTEDGLVRCGGTYFDARTGDVVEG